MGGARANHHVHWPSQLLGEVRERGPRRSPASPEVLGASPFIVAGGSTTHNQPAAEPGSRPSPVLSLKGAVRAGWVGGSLVAQRPRL